MVELVQNMVCPIANALHQIAWKNVIEHSVLDDMKQSVEMSSRCKSNFRSSEGTPKT